MTRPPAAEVIAVGSEMLTPHRVDTNSLYLTARLNEAGYQLRGKSVVGDDPIDLDARIRQALASADVVIATGGLGPTADDITREVVAAALGLPLDEDAAALEAIRGRFARRGVPMPATNRKQAMKPRGATVLANDNGTAPGLLIELARQIVVLLPGPPGELQPMFERGVWPVLVARAGGSVLRRRVMRIGGRAESEVDEIAQPIYVTLSTDRVRVETTILAAGGQIELHLTGSGADAAAIESALAAGVERLSAALAPSVISADGRTLEQVVGEQLQTRGWTIAAAESCTGGLLLGRLTDVPGSSAWVAGGVVAYANAVKIAALDVSAAALAAHGAVSETVASAMAAGARTRIGADVGVAVTGIAGPGGGSESKPVGTVVIAVVTPTASFVRTYAFAGDRQTIRLRSVVTALDVVRRLTA